MSKFLMEQLESKFKKFESEEEIEEANVTGNMDGGAGPIKTPSAFAKSKDEDDLDTDHIEVLGYKKSKKSKQHFESVSKGSFGNLLKFVLEKSLKEC
jgi:hypothetical protein